MELHVNSNVSKGSALQCCTVILCLYSEMATWVINLCPPLIPVSTAYLHRIAYIQAGRARPRWVIDRKPGKSDSDVNPMRAWDEMFKSGSILIQIKKEKDATDLCSTVCTYQWAILGSWFILGFRLLIGMFETRAGIRQALGLRSRESLFSGGIGIRH